MAGDDLFAGFPSPAPLPPKPPGSRWTDQQWAGIATSGKSLLVSAAAGSGKTAVLAERCAYLVCDAPQTCDVDELLVVTFTEAAAAEMKSRIEKALHERIAKSPDAHDHRLARQLALVDRAQVSTLHGFCAKLIRQHFHLLELDPAFTVLDGDEASLLRTEIARELFEQRYEGDRREPFERLIDAYGDGNDEKLVGKVIHTHQLLESLVDPQAWLRRSRERIAGAVEGDFRKSDLGRELDNEVAAGIRALRQSCARSLAGVSAMGGFEKYVGELQNCSAIIEKWAAAFEQGGPDAVEALLKEELSNLPRVPESTPGKKVAKALVDAVRDEIKGGKLREILAFSTQEWRDGLAAIRPHADVFLDLVEEFGRRYGRAKAAMRGVDFADLERFALRALRDPSSAAELPRPSGVARLLHRQFAHVLVDEYQDINEVQDAILSLASRECIAADDEGSVGNLFTVGDVKQSIYRFRLAEPARFLNRQDRFREAANQKDIAGGEVIDLQSNFRSRAPLLGSINDVFERLMTREAADIEYDATQKLVPGLTYPPGDGKTTFAGSPIELHVLPDNVGGDPAHDHGHDQDDGNGDDDESLDRAQREAQLIARRIRELMGQDEASGSPRMRVVERDPVDQQLKARSIKYGDIVVLLRAMKRKGEDYADVLRRSGIPVHSDAGSGYFESMEVADVLALLKVLDNRAQDIPLAAVLRSPIAGLPHAEDALATIRLAYKDKTAVPFHRAVVRYAAEHDDELAAKLRDVLRQLDEWRKMVRRRPLAELIWDVYDSTGYLAFCAGLRDGEQRKANLVDLHDRARQFGSFQRQGLSRFLAFLEALREESDLGPPPVVAEGEDVVRIMTVHQSKGLEFPVVFLPDLGKRINLQDASGSILIDRHAHLGMEVVDEERQVRYPSLASTLVSSRLRRQSMAEELRVLYVAMTRAKEHLVLIGTARGAAALVDGWAARWANHVGALPADTVLESSNMLGWLGPAAVAVRGTGRREPIELIVHDAEEIRGWPTPESLRPSEGERQERLARLEPLDPAPSADTVADEIIARLTTPYEFEAFTRIAAVEAATALAKKAAPILSAVRVTDSATRRADVARLLELPRAVRTELKPSAADVGEATHLVLQHLDFAKPCDTSDLKSQISDLESCRLITPAAAKLVDVDALCWLVGSPVGRMLREYAVEALRELPLYLAIEPEGATSEDPQDRVMVRSRADALVRTSRGYEVIDYKTDRVDEQTLAARVEFYRPQMELYRRAIGAVTGEAVVAVHLVFLNARRIVTL